MKNMENCEIELEKLKEENENLRESLAIALNKPLLKELEEAINGIKSGEFYSEEEFAERFNLTNA